MEIHKLNCIACGAPISVPDDVDHLNCTSCGSFLAIQRGEGFVAFKMAEKISRSIEDTSRKTQETIRQGNQSTQYELQRLRFQYELSTAQTKLDSVQSDIRRLNSNVPNYTASMQKLRHIEFDALESIRDIQKRMYSLEEDTVVNKIALFQNNFILCRYQDRLYHTQTRNKLQ